MTLLTVILSVIIFLLLTLISVILFVKFKICISVRKKDGKKPKTDISIYLPGGIKITNFDNKKSKKTKKKDKNNKPKNKKDETKYSDKNFFEKAKNAYKLFNEIKCTYSLSKKKIKKKIVADKIILNLNFGLSDAAKTGIATGTLWACVYNILGFISKIITIGTPEINITPIFEKKYIEFESECIFTARGVNLISIIASLGINYIKVRKNNKNKGGE